MNNATELFQPEYGRMDVPGATVLVYLDGQPCEDLAPLEIVRSAWPDFGWARLTCNQRAVVTEPAENRFAMGRQISLRQIYNRCPPEVVLADLSLFVGRIETVETTIRSREQKIELIARDFGAELRRITVYGQRILKDDGSTILLAGLETTFNPLGQGNATREPVWIQGRARTVFSPNTDETWAWTCADAIHYLLTEYVPPGSLYCPDIEELLALTQHQCLRDLDVTGLNLLEALHRCSESAGIQFQFVPRLTETGPAQAIVFHRTGQSRQIELNCQPAGETLDPSQTSIAAMHSERAFHPITHRYIGQGDFKVYEATFELAKAWDPALEGTDYSVFCPSTNSQFHQVKDVYRKWCLNEAGDYSVSPFNQGEPYDFSTLFERAPYVRRRRRFWPTLSTDAQGDSLGYVVEVSYDDGVHWWGYPHAFSNLLGECGIWLSSDQLDVDTWIAALKGVLRVRITASVVSDERLTCTVADGPVGSTIPVVDHVLTLPRQFAYRKVSTQSVYTRMSTSGLGIPDEADDSVALHQFVRRHAAAAPAVVETTDVQTSTLRLHLCPGDIVTSRPESRDLLSCRRDSRSIVWIERIHMDFANQCTNLRLVRQRMYPQ